MTQDQGIQGRMLDTLDYCNASVLLWCHPVPRMHPMRATTTLKLSEDLKARIARLAEETGRSPHGFMIDALERQVLREERWRDFINDAHASDRAIDEGAAVYRAKDVHRWLDRLAQNPGAERPKPWRK